MNSYKKIPRGGMKNRKSWKKIYNRKDRRKPISDDEYAPRRKCEYKKRNNRYDICDYKVTHISFDEYFDGEMLMYITLRNRGLKNVQEPIMEDCLQWYLKEYKRK